VLGVLPGVVCARVWGVSGLVCLVWLRCAWCSALGGVPAWGVLAWEVLAWACLGVTGSARGAGHAAWTWGRWVVAPGGRCVIAMWHAKF